MESLDLFTIETIVETICPQCTPEHGLPERACLEECFPLPCGDLGTERERIASLAALCMSSRQISTMATPHLYHRPTCSSWWLLARTLLARPDLARRVRHLCTRGWTDGGTADALSSLDELQSYWGRQVPDGLEYCDDISDITDLPMNDVMLLVSSLCPDVEELAAVVDDEEITKFQEPVALEKLRTTALSYADTENGLALEFVNPVLQSAPNIETLVGWQVGTDAHAADLANLKHLRLENSSVTSEGLRDLLSSCPRQESFRFVAGGPTVGDEHFEPDEAQRAIVALVPRLKSLHLDLDDAFFPHITITEFRLVADLTPLTELESLSLDTRCLQPHNSPGVSGGSSPPLDAEALTVGDSSLVDLLPASIREFRVFGGPGGPDLAQM